MMGSENTEALNKMTNEKLWQLFPIMLSEHQDSWKNDFITESNNIKNNVCSENIVRINHVGSTAVPGLLAKPTIDILLEIDENTDINKLIHEMENIGYISTPQSDKPSPKIMFMKGYTLKGFKPPVYHVHVRYLGDWDEIWFRNYLRENHEALKEYANLKLSLKEKFEHNRDAYTNAKTQFVQRITSLARQEKKTKDYQGRVPACGVFCGGCPMYNKEKKPCLGAEVNCKRCEGCKTFHLCCKEQGVTNCFQCKTFPCYKFKRFANTWLKYGQDLVENQYLLEKVGEDKFLKYYNSINR